MLWPRDPAIPPVGYGATHLPPLTSLENTLKCCPTRL
nr:MAG TPA: hypothetical protein [Caudoviricetes sp.]